jgi:hypothetical protein
MASRFGVSLGLALVLATGTAWGRGERAQDYQAAGAVVGSVLLLV